METNIKKNQEYIVDIVDNGYQGEGIAKINNFTIFIQGAIKGEKIKILIIKVTSSHAYGKILEIIKKSKYREDTDCNVYSKCGGCNLRHMKYEYTLNVKKEIVQNCIYKEFVEKLKINNVIGMEKPIHYRNKLQYPLGEINNKQVIGIYRNRTHEIIEVKECFIQNKTCQKIANEIYEFILQKNIKVYNEINKTGIVRHIVIKIGVSTNEIMVILVLNKDSFTEEKKLVDILTNKYPEIKTIVKNINNKDTNVILGNKNKIIYGNGFIYDKLGELKFKISPLSFYQVNPIQTKILYDKAIGYAKLDKNDIVYDLYCGIGTIGLFASKHIKKLYGIEVVEDAIKDAKENAKINNITNAEFLVGEVENILPELVKKDIPNVVFVDPPRKGLDVKTIDILLNLKSKKIIYISCNPATLARDLKLLNKNYEIKEIQPVDMFPYTSHVECCVLLCLK